MSDENKAFIAATVADVQKKSINQGFTLNISGPAGDWAWAFGDGNRRPQVPMGINDRGRIGSTTKSFISRLILREIDRKTPIPGVVPSSPVTLDTKLFHFVSGVPRSDQISIKDMLMMRSVSGYSSQCMYHPPTGAVIAGLENYQSANVAIFSQLFVPIAEKLYPGSML